MYIQSVKGELSSSSNAMPPERLLVIVGINRSISSEVELKLEPEVTKIELDTQRRLKDRHEVVVVLGLWRRRRAPIAREPKVAQLYTRRPSGCRTRRLGVRVRRRESDPRAERGEEGRGR